MVDARNTPHFEPSPIDYTVFASALQYYPEHGYPYLEVPWVVSLAAMEVTLPPNAEATQTQYGNLVGSGEQSFIELLMRGEQLLKACCITPCFRLEPNYDDLHHGYFMKLELIDTIATKKNLDAMIGIAALFYERYTAVNIVETGNDMYDIVDSELGIELGSYGFRRWGTHRFIYGTGVAEPRLSTVLKKQKDAKL